MGTAANSKAYFWVTVAYLAALLLGGLAGYYVWTQDYPLTIMNADYSWLLVVGTSDVVATIVIFIFSYLFNNSSFYDPYWSLIPIFIVLFLAYVGWESGADKTRMVIMQLLVAFWGIRLTYNWLRGWSGLGHQDWRYVELQKQNGKWYWPVSFSGIHMLPTVLVFMGCFALFTTFTMPGKAFGWLDMVATLFTLGAILIELIADEQLHRFIKNKTKPGETLTSGLWAYSRHPNYFGETSFWWGLFIFAMAARPDQWWVVVGPLCMTLLFQFISIPMIDKRMLKRRENYQEVMDRIPAWIPWFPKKG